MKPVTINGRNVLLAGSRRSPPLAASAAHARWGVFAACMKLREAIARGLGADPAQAVFANDQVGVGELGICGDGAAVANAVYNAIGIRVRDYPVTLDCSNACRPDAIAQPTS